MVRRHAPFYKKKPWRLVLPMCPFSFLQTIRKIAWSKCDNSSELSNFDPIVKINFFLKKCRLLTEGEEKGRKGRSSLMPKPNEILQQVYKMFHQP